MSSWIATEDEAGLTIAVRVIPRARHTVVTGLHGDALKIRLAAPPVEGAANKALIAFLAHALGVRKRDVHLVSGERSRLKLVRIDGLDARTAKARLLPGASG